MTPEEQLVHEPAVETKNRKPLEPPAGFGATRELRFGPDNRFRVFYEAHEDRREVRVLAAGVKTGSTLRIGAEVLEL